MDEKELIKLAKANILHEKDKFVEFIKKRFPDSEIPDYEKCTKCGSRIFKRINTDLICIRTNEGVSVFDAVDEDARNIDIVCEECGERWEQCAQYVRLD